MQTFKNLFLLGSIILLFNRCGGYQHVATPHFVVDDCNKGTLSADLSFSSVQFGYCPTNNLHVFINGFSRNRSNSYYKIFLPEDKVNQSNDRQLSLGAGYYFPDFYAGSDLYAHYGVQYGTGFGKLNYDHISHEYYDPASMYMKSNYYHTFAQPFFGLKMDWFFIGLSHKFEYKYYYKIRTKTAPSNANIASFHSEDQIFINHKKVHGFFYEPSFMLKLGNKDFKLQAQLVPCGKLTNLHIREKEFSIYLSAYLNFDLIK